MVSEYTLIYLNTLFPEWYPSILYFILKYSPEWYPSILYFTLKYSPEWYPSILYFILKYSPEWTLPCFVLGSCSWSWFLVMWWWCSGGGRVAGVHGWYGTRGYVPPGTPPPPCRSQLAVRCYAAPRHRKETALWAQGACFPGLGARKTSRFLELFLDGRPAGSGHGTRDRMIQG